MTRERLFDAAVNKAHTYAARLGLSFRGRKRLTAGLELWYLKTRFAYRIPLGDVLDALERYPTAAGRYTWVGGREGTWQPAEPRRDP